MCLRGVGGVAIGSRCHYIPPFLSAAAAGRRVPVAGHGGAVGIDDLVIVVGWCPVALRIMPTIGVGVRRPVFNGSRGSAGAVLFQ